MSQLPIHRWHQLIASGDPAGLDTLLADDAVFHSPVVHTPQAGKALTRAYLSAAMAVLNNDSFRYVRELNDGQHSVLEFQLELDGISVNGVDMIQWDEHGRIIDFKVMLRPYKALDAVRERMMAMLTKQG
ncbi:hypothetical protein A11A3_12318 [Alcanivorax hongdengensis A-11-3]|uniref:SnoaL-like domain-containing protein n=1 Tax=Alcanivorax hongdengensis A-11-3 TaxID=1177179 RepID=L0WAE7_9GAMM|nr:nuclear transport factor 2 family protein [Alcanivorax hongdengensis]EKF73748.1 hypothetical protein A11A3_12318 [Alcanivorax hongdengensis A-11-3]